MNTPMKPNATAPPSTPSSTSRNGNTLPRLMISGFSTLSIVDTAKKPHSRMKTPQPVWPSLISHSAADPGARGDGESSERLDVLIQKRQQLRGVMRHVVPVRGDRRPDQRRGNDPSRRIRRPRLQDLAPPRRHPFRVIGNRQPDDDER